MLLARKAKFSLFLKKSLGRLSSSEQRGKTKEELDGGRAINDW